MSPLQQVARVLISTFLVTTQADRPAVRTRSSRTQSELDTDASAAALVQSGILGSGEKEQGLDKAELAALFGFLDTDGSGSLDSKEFASSAPRSWDAIATTSFFNALDSGEESKDDTKKAGQGKDNTKKDGLVSLAEFQNKDFFRNGMISLLDQHYWEIYEKEMCSLFSVMFFNAADPNSDGEITFEEFETLCEAEAKKQQNKIELEHVFHTECPGGKSATVAFNRALDRDNDGSVDMIELAHAVSDL